ncbi:MAG: ABC transporter permease [Spirochaetales bacterium]|nr:ABC transporter permease [Spirochaetales bacterium]
MKLVNIALKNTLRQKKRSVMLAGAIAFGLIVMTAINGLTNGLTESVKQNIANSLSGHIFVNAAEISPDRQDINVIRDDSLVIEALGNSGLDYLFITRRSNLHGTLIFGSREINQAIQGVNWQDEPGFMESLHITGGSVENLRNPRAVILPEKSAAKLGVQIGEEITVHTSTVSGQNNLGEFILAATVADEGGFGLSNGFANLRYVNELINIKGGEFTSINVYLNDIGKTRESAERLHNELAKIAETDPLEKDEDQAVLPGSGPSGGRTLPMMKGMMSRVLPGPGFADMFGGQKNGPGSETKTVYSITTVEDLTGGMETIVSVFDTLSLIVFGVLLLIIMVGITNSFRMILIERTREIGTLRAMGMQKTEVKTLFILEAFIIAVSGALAGVIIAAALMGGFSLIEFGTNETLSMFLTKGSLLFKIGVAETVRNILIVAAVSIAAAWSPAGKAGKLLPAEALRAQY